MSGSAIAPWASVNNANENSLRIAQAADCVNASRNKNDLDGILNCLRDVPVEKIQQAAASITDGHRSFHTLFGPSVDGVVIRGDIRTSGPHKRSEERASYDILFGINGFESAYQLSGAAIDNGFNSSEKDLLLRSFVAETYRFHQTEIFLTLVNEYTDWERTIQHPLSIRDSAIEALSDGQFVAPAIALGDALTRQDKNSYFYIIDPASFQVKVIYHGNVIIKLMHAFIALFTRASIKHI